MSLFPTKFQRSKENNFFKKLSKFCSLFLNLSSLKTPILERFHQRKVTVPRAFSMREGVKGKRANFVPPNLWKRLVQIRCGGGFYTFEELNPHSADLFFQSVSHLQT